MPRKQRFKPSRKPKPITEEVGKTTIEQQTRSTTPGERVPDRERQDIVPEEVEPIERQD